MLTRFSVEPIYQHGMLRERVPNDTLSSWIGATSMAVAALAGRREGCGRTIAPRPDVARPCLSGQRGPYASECQRGGTIK